LIEAAFAGYQLSTINYQLLTINCPTKAPTARGDRFLTSDGVTGGG